MASGSPVGPASIVDGVTKWQATWRPGITSSSGGSIWWQTGCAMGQRVQKLQPLGGFAGDGTSPFRMIRARVDSRAGSGSGTAESSATA